MTSDTVLSVLRSEPWCRRSNRAIAAHLYQLHGKPSPGRILNIVQKLRVLHDLRPKLIETIRDGVPIPIRSGRIGNRNGHRKRRRPLTPRMQDLLADATPTAERLSAKYANTVLDSSELLGIAHTTLIRIVRYWRPSLGRSWRTYAAEGIREGFRRAFWAKRCRLKRESLFRTEQPTSTTSSAESLAERFHDLRGLPRITVIWLSGLDGCKRRTADDIARFWKIPVPLAQEMIDEARDCVSS